MEYTDLVQFDTKLTADVCEWQPGSNVSNNCLACATYQLNKETNKRHGCLYLIDYNYNTNQLQLNQTINFNSSGILDMKWLNKIYLATLDSNETIELFNIDNQTQSLKSIYSINPNQENTNDPSIGLTFDYQLISESSSDSFNVSKLVTSNSNGELNIIDCLDNSKFNVINRFQAHDYEIWSVLIDSVNDHIIYSGADDSMLKTWDQRELKSPVQKYTFFNGGVCTILSVYNKQTKSLISNFNEFNLICSSYDEQIYILDKRNTKTWVNKSKKLNGGVWKLRFNKDYSHLLCACMHTGVHVVDVENLESKLYYDKHGLNNLAYGCDWKLINETNNYLVSTCSFYNHELRIWKLIN